MVAPLAGAWIEIVYLTPLYSMFLVAPLAGAWIEIRFECIILACYSSRSPRGSVD